MQQHPMAHCQSFTSSWPCQMCSGTGMRPHIGARTTSLLRRAGSRAQKTGKHARCAASNQGMRSVMSSPLAQSASTAWLPRSTPPSQAPLRLDLWQCLLQAGAAKLISSIEDANTTASTGLEKLSRYVLPPPSGFPPGPSGDQSVPLLSDSLRFLTATATQYGGVAGMLLGGERIVLVTDTVAARQVLIDQPQVFGKDGTAFFPGSSLTGNGLLTSDGDSWRRQRRLSNPAFRRAAVDCYAAEMASSAAALMDGTWAATAVPSSSGRSPDQHSQQHQEGIRDVYADFNALTLRITLAALFGIAGTTESSRDDSRDDTSDTAAQIVSSVRHAFQYLARRGTGIGMLIPEWLPTADNLEFAAAVAQLDDIVYRIIAQRRAKQARDAGHAEAADGRSAGQPGAAGSDLLQALLEAVDENGRGMSDGALRDELMTLLVAGQETSAIVLGWASALLAHNPTAQARAADEVASVLQGRPVDAEAARQLPYVEAVVLEALRLYSPAYMVGRCANSDVVLRSSSGAQYQLPAGTTILVSPYVMHRDPAHWEQPEVFMPQRWLDFQQAGQGSNGGGSAVLLRDMGPNGAFLPFGAGPRNCIGTGFAMMEAILVLAVMLQRFEVMPASSGAEFPTARPVLTLRPDGVPLRMVQRESVRHASQSQPVQHATKEEAVEQQADSHGAAAVPVAAW